jgi:hypothetical protein
MTRTMLTTAVLAYVCSCGPSKAEVQAAAQARASAVRAEHEAYDNLLAFLAESDRLFHLCDTEKEAWIKALNAHSVALRGERL